MKRNPAKRQPDATVRGGLGLYLITPLTPAARAWVAANVAAEPWQWVSGGLAVDDGRLARDVADGMRAAGLKVA